MNQPHDFSPEYIAYKEEVMRKHNEIRERLRKTKIFKVDINENSKACNSDKNAEKRKNEAEIIDAWNRESKYANIGSLQLNNGDIIPLKLGYNSIGRGSDATITIEKNNLRISRQHLIIKIKGQRNDGYVHEAQISKPGVNETRINNVIMTFGKTYRLKNGDIISIPSGNVKFKFVSFSRK